MYGLRQAAILAYKYIKDNLEPYGYHPIPGTTGMWKHESRPISFCLCVDDFGIKYINKQDVDHLLNAIGKIYKYTIDWTGTHYCGMTLDWHYDDGYVDVSMLDYVQKTLKKLQHKPKIFPQYSPHISAPIHYGKKGSQQLATTPNTSTLLSPKETTYIQPIAGSFL